MQTTIFLDIDGVLVTQYDHVANRYHDGVPDTLIDGTLEKLIEWDRKGYQIILTTGRRECWRKKTEETLQRLGIFYDQLVMGVGIGKRVVINDTKPSNPDVPMAEAINLRRNEGIANVEIKETYVSLK